MRKLLLRIVIGFITFVVGISCVLLAAMFRSTQPDSVFVIEPVYKAEIGRPRFFPTGRGCGNGYTQGYETDDGQFLAEGVSAGRYPTGPKRDFHKWVHDAEQVLERVPKFRNHLGEVGERVIIVNKPSDSGQKSVSILFFDRSDYYRFIDAPTLDLALEFEQYLISIDFKSPV